MQLSAMNKSRETVEARAFDEAVLVEYGKLKDEDLIFPEDFLKKHLNLTKPPIIAYRYAIYLLKDSDIKNQNVLNVACGTGYESIILAKKGANVFAFDISPESVKMAQKRAVLNNLSDKIHTVVMSVYELKFPDEAFKYIYGNACLHHFDLEKALKEIYRVLEAGGVAVFCEAFGASRMLQKVRDLIPLKKNKVSPEERQLTYEDISVISKIFHKVVAKEFGFFIRLERLIKSKRIRELLFKIDFILSKIPTLRKFASSVVIKVIK